MKFKVEPKDFLLFVIYCLVLLYLCALAVSNLFCLINTGTFYGLLPLSAFSVKYLPFTIGLFIGALILIFTSVSSYIFDKQKGQGIGLKIGKDKQKIEELKKRWKPEIDEKYFYISYEGTVCVAPWSNDDLDNWRYFIGIVFQTPQEAKEYRKKIEIQAQFKDFVEERSEKLDWGNENQDKYYLYYNYITKNIIGDYYG